jgi:hypothetical protein
MHGVIHMYVLPMHASFRARCRWPTDATRRGATRRESRTAEMGCSTSICAPLAQTGPLAALAAAANATVQEVLEHDGGNSWVYRIRSDQIDEVLRDVGVDSIGLLAHDLCVHAGRRIAMTL